VRDVPLLPPAADAVRGYRMSLPAAAIGTALLFPSESGGCHGPSYNMAWTDKPYRKNGKMGLRVGWARKAGVINKSFHVLRHTCGCHLLQGTWRQWVGELDIKDVSAWLGHSDINVTQRHYAALSKDSLTNRVQRVLRSRPFNESGEL
jgi:Site-specific recombinase XerD